MKGLTTTLLLVALLATAACTAELTPPPESGDTGDVGSVETDVGDETGGDGADIEVDAAEDVEE